MSHERQGRKLCSPGRHLGGVPSNGHFPSSDTARAEGTGGATGPEGKRTQRWPPTWKGWWTPRRGVTRNALCGRRAGGSSSVLRPRERQRLFAFRLFQCPKMVAFWDSYREDGSAAARLCACRKGAPWDTHVRAAPGATANSNIWREMTRWAAGWDIISPLSSRRPSVI